MLTYEGRMILYFNRPQNAPRVWCVADPDRRWELCVCKIEFVGFLSSNFVHYDPPADKDVIPAGYFVVEGQLSVDLEGTARIRAKEHV